MRESRFVGSTGLNEVAWGEDIGPNSYYGCPFMVYRCTHKCACSLWQVCYPSSGRKSRESCKNKALNHSWAVKNMKEKQVWTEVKQTEKKRRADVYLSTTWSLVGCGAMVFLTYWYTSVLSSRVSITRLSSRSSSQWACSRRTRVRMSSGLAGTSAVTFHSRSGKPSWTWRKHVEKAALVYM